MLPRDPLIQEFVRYISTEKRLSPNTVEAYSRDLAQWERFATSDGTYPLSPASTSVSDLRLWVAALARRPDMSQRSIRRKVQSLRAFFNFMMRRHGLGANPAAALALARLPHTLPVFARTDEINALLDSPLTSDDDFIEVRDRLILTVFYETGIRCSELMTLEDANINTITGELKVHGKRNKDRVVPFGEELSRMIEHYRRLRDKTAGQAAGFFLRPDGKPLSRPQIYAIVHRRLAEGGIHAARLSPHMLRHTFATDMVNGGASLSAVQQLLGHASLATTQIYTHVTYNELIANYQTAHPRATKKGG